MTRTPLTGLIDAATTRLDRVLPARFRRTRTVTVELTIDTTQLDAGLARREPVPRIPGVLSLDFRPIIEASRIMADNIRNTMAAINKVMNSPAVAAAIRQQRDLDEIRAIGRTELRRARNHLDWHVEGVYADLGLQRTPDA